MYQHPLTGVYGSDTLSAVKNFQSSKGIENDGVVGRLTLMYLYRSLDPFGFPSLTEGKK
jgi:murein L,D-transpeptidase YcbB/YkuD